MPEAFRRSVTIAATPEAVWSTLTDWSIVSSWMERVDWVDTTSDPPLQVGSTLEFHARGKKRPAEITRLQEPHELTITSVEGPVRTDYTYTLRSTDDGTELELVAQCAARGFIRLFAPLLRRAMAKTDGDQPEALKELVEAG